MKNLQYYIDQEIGNQLNPMKKRICLLEIQIQELQTPPAATYYTAKTEDPFSSAGVHCNRCGNYPAASSACGIKECPCGLYVP